MTLKHINALSALFAQAQSRGARPRQQLPGLNQDLLIAGKNERQQRHGLRWHGLGAGPINPAPLALVFPKYQGFGARRP